MTIELFIQAVPEEDDDERDDKESTIAKVLFDKIRTLRENFPNIKKFGITVPTSSKRERKDMRDARETTNAGFVNLRGPTANILRKMAQLMKPSATSINTDPTYSKLAGLVKPVPISLTGNSQEMLEDLKYIKQFAHSDKQHLILWGLSNSEPYGVPNEDIFVTLNNELGNLVQWSNDDVEWSNYDVAWEKLFAIAGQPNASRSEPIPQLARAILANVTILQDQGEFQDTNNRNTITRIITLTVKILQNKASHKEVNEYIQLADLVEGNPSLLWKVISAGMLLTGLMIIAFAMMSSFDTWGDTTMLFGSLFLGASSIYSIAPAGLIIAAGIICSRKFSGHRRGLPKTMMDVSNYPDDPDNSPSPAKESARGFSRGSLT